MAKLKDTEVTGSLVASGSIKSNTPGASLASVGTVKLNDSITNTSTTEAATPSAVKKVKDITDSLNSKVDSTKSELNTTINNKEKDLASKIASTKTELEGLISKKENAFSKNSAFNKNYETNAANFKVAGTAAPGALDTIARADHIHPLQTSVSGNAGSASKLATARKIELSGNVSGSANFDGTANISIPVVVANDSHNHTVLNSKNSGTILKDFGNGNVTVSAAKDASGVIGDLYIGYNTSSNFTKNVRLESPLNWKGGSVYIIDANGKVDWNVLKNIPSAAGLGALPLAGGTMTGKAHFNIATGSDAITIGGSARNAFIGKTTDQGGIGIGCDSSLLLFAGDNYTPLKDGIGLAAATTSEQVIIGADNIVRVITNMQDNYASSKEFSFGTNGRLTAPNDFYVGSNRVYHQGFKPTYSDVGALAAGGKAVDSAKLNGVVESEGSNASTLVKRTSSGDVNCRLVKSEYADQNTIGGAMAFRVNNSNDNFVRFCNSPSVIRNWLGAMVNNPSSIDMTKNGTISRINFNAQQNDPGYIEHYESNNTSRLRISVSDDIANGQDAFEIGSTSGSTWTPRFRVWTDGATEIVHPSRTWYEGGNIWSSSGPSGTAHKGALWIQV